MILAILINEINEGYTVQSLLMFTNLFLLFLYVSFHSKQSIFVKDHDFVFIIAAFNRYNY